ncbi:hypothetical protein WIN67_13525 [Pseudomonas idahonensis]|uniref:hypothetical protein n=1 Tax=Pseudomonas TaxID=286 RepID=UPI0025D01A1F|nr:MULTISPECIES: hypothetical protein [Pseudomonas]MBW8356541.1 hypothetical protein [Pseudomonas sp.]MDP9512123.1 hypothetical protein [Pseudomonas protegens]
MHSKVDVAVMIGSGVPPMLRELGRKACWVVLVNGEQRGTAFASRVEAEECRQAWQAKLAQCRPGRHAFQHSA